jgi:hypothetical protein
MMFIGLQLGVLTHVEPAETVENHRFPVDPSPDAPLCFPFPLVSSRRPPFLVFLTAAAFPPAFQRYRFTSSRTDAAIPPECVRQTSHNQS